MINNSKGRVWLLPGAAPNIISHSKVQLTSDSAFHMRTLNCVTMSYIIVSNKNITIIHILHTT